MQIYDNYEFSTEVLVASCRNPIHIVDAARMGADICTCPPAVIDQLFNHPLTTIGLETIPEGLGEGVPVEGLASTLTHMDPTTALEALERRAEQGGGETACAGSTKPASSPPVNASRLLFDPDTFEEVDKLVTHRCLDFGMAEQQIPGDGVVAGHGLVDGRQVFAFAQDFTVFGGSLVRDQRRKDRRRSLDLAMKLGSPVVGLNDSGGARIQGRRAVARRLRRHLPAQYAGVRCRAPDQPHHGSVCGGGVLAGHHRTSTSWSKARAATFVTGPDVIKAARRGDLGRKLAHNDAQRDKSGVAHFAVPEDERRSCVHPRSPRSRPTTWMMPASAPAEDAERDIPELDDAGAGVPNQPYDISI